MMEQSDLKHTWIDVDGLRIHCLVAGESGPALVLLHGGGTDSASLSWSEVMPPLSAHHQVFAPDWPGFGQSDKPAISYTTDYYVHYLQHLLSTLNLERAILIGLSMGGGIALNFTLSHPAQVEKLVLVDPYYGFKSPADKWSYLFIRLPLVMDLPTLLGRHRTLVGWGLSNVLQRPERRTPSLIDEVCQEALAKRAGKAYASWARSEVTWNGPRTQVESRLHEIAVPTLLIQGAQDKLVPVSFAHRAHALIAHSQLVILPGCGHWVQRDDPQAFLQAVEPFLEMRNMKGSS
jgi:pimeloyl-ACP methyl ester carboxylesterase